MFAPAPARATCGPDGAAAPICLAGTAIAPGYAGALLETAGQPGVRSVQAGDTIDDWAVREIGVSYVVLSRGDRTVRLDIGAGVSDVPTPKPAVTGPKPTFRQGPMAHARSLARGDRD